MRQASQSVMKTLLVPVALGWLIAAGLVAPSCKKDEPPPPLPSATPEPEQEVALPMLAEEDAGEPDADAAKKATGPYKPGGSLKACCAALAQNAASATPPTNTYMMAAAGICQGAVAGGNTAGAIPAIRNALRGANMPAACK